MKLKSFNDFINEELRKVVSDKSGSGKTKFIDWIWDEPTSDKSLSAGVSLRDKLREEEFQDLIKDLPQNVSKNFIRKQKSKKKAEKLAVTLNNLQFLKDKQKEKGELHCEYCDKGPLVIYDISPEEIERGPQKIGGRLRYNVRFNPKDGATCDHKQPQSKGGDKFDYGNLAVCCYSCNQRKKNMTWDEWSKILQNRQVNEASYNLETKRLISDLFTAISDEYNIKESEWNNEHSGGWLAWYNEHGNLINHYELTNWTTHQSWVLRIFYRGSDSIHSEFESDLDRFIKRLRKFGFKTGPVHKEDYGSKIGNHHGKIYSAIIKPMSQLNEALIPLNSYMKNLTGIETEDLEDYLIELSDEYDLEFRPGLLYLDENGRPKTSDHWDIKGQISFDEFIDSKRVKYSNGKIIPDLDIDHAWGWVVEFWKKGEPKWRYNRVCDKKSMQECYRKINHHRLEKLDLDSSVVLNKSTGGANVDNDIYSIAIWSVK